MSNLSDFVVLPLAMGAPVEIQEEGAQVTAAVTSINFVGDNVTVTPAGQGVDVAITGGGGGGGGIKGPWTVTPTSLPPTVNAITAGGTYNPLTSVLTSPDMSTSANVIDGVVVTFQGAEAFDNTFNKFVSMNLGAGHDTNVFALAGFIDAALTPAQIRQAVENALINNTAGLPAGFNVGAWIQFFSLAGGMNTQTYTWNGSDLNSSSQSLGGVPDPLTTFLLNKWNNGGDQTMVAVGMESSDGNVNLDSLSVEALTAESELTVGVGELTVSLQAFYAVFSVGNFGPYVHISGAFSGTFNQDSTLPAVSIPVSSNFDNIHTPTSQALFDSYFTAPYVGLSAEVQAEFPPSTAVNDQYRIVGTGSPYGIDVVPGDIVVVDNVTPGLEDFRVTLYEPLVIPPVVQSAADTPYDPVTSLLVAITVQAAIDEVEGRVDATEIVADDAATAISDHTSNGVGAHAASAISYVNTTSGLAADTAQEAIDELDDRLDNLPVPTKSYFQVHIVTGAGDGYSTFASTDVAGAYDALKARLNEAADQSINGIIWIETTTSYWDVTSVVADPTYGRIQIRGNRSLLASPTLLVRLYGPANNPFNSLPYLDYLQLSMTNEASIPFAALTSATTNTTWRIGSDVSLYGPDSVTYTPSTFNNGTCLIRLPNRLTYDVFTIRFDKNLLISSGADATSEYNCTFAGTGLSPYTSTSTNLRIIGENLKVTQGPGNIFTMVGLSVEDSGHFDRGETPRTRIPTSIGSSVTNTPANAAAVTTTIYKYDVGSTPVHLHDYALVWGGGNSVSLATNSLYSHGGFFIQDRTTNLDLAYFLNEASGGLGNKVTVAAYGVSIDVSPVFPSTVTMSGYDVDTFVILTGGFRILNSSV